MNLLSCIKFRTRKEKIFPDSYIAKSEYISIESIDIDSKIRCSCKGYLEFIICVNAIDYTYEYHQYIFAVFQCRKCSKVNLVKMYRNEDMYTEIHIPDKNNNVQISKLNIYKESIYASIESTQTCMVNEYIHATDSYDVRKTLTDSNSTTTHTTIKLHKSLIIYCHCCEKTSRHVFIVNVYQIDPWKVFFKEVINHSIMKCVVCNSIHFYSWCNNPIQSFTNYYLLHYPYESRKKLDVPLECL